MRTKDNKHELIRPLDDVEKQRFKCPSWCAGHILSEFPTLWPYVKYTRLAVTMKLGHYVPLLCDEAYALALYYSIEEELKTHPGKLIQKLIRLKPHPYQRGSDG